MYTIILPGVSYSLQKAIEVFDIKEPTLPHRNSEKKQLRQDQWYG